MITPEEYTREAEADKPSVIQRSLERLNELNYKKTAQILGSAAFCGVVTYAVLKGVEVGIEAFVTPIPGSVATSVEKALVSVEVVMGGALEKGSSKD